MPSDGPGFKPGFHVRLHGKGSGRAPVFHGVGAAAIWRYWYRHCSCGGVLLRKTGEEVGITRNDVLQSGQDRASKKYRHHVVTGASSPPDSYKGILSASGLQAKKDFEFFTRARLRFTISSWYMTVAGTVE